MQAIILAGGKGSRLKPFTKVIPKPLVPISDDMAILEVILNQLKEAGFSEITMAVNHMSKLIMAFFQDGKELGLNITYSLEDQPLGTAGPLALVQDVEENVLVMNGDILTTLNYADLYKFHKEKGADITISTYEKKVKIDLGVLETENGQFMDYIEKPEYSFTVSMGIYILNKKALSLIPHNQKFDLPDLVLKAKQEGLKIQCYAKDYYWLDIGRVDDYDQAIQIFQERRGEFLPTHKRVQE